MKELLGAIADSAKDFRAWGAGQNVLLRPVLLNRGDIASETWCDARIAAHAAAGKGEADEGALSEVRIGALCSGVSRSERSGSAGDRHQCARAKRSSHRGGGTALGRCGEGMLRIGYFSFWLDNCFSDCRSLSPGTRNDESGFSRRLIFASGCKAVVRDGCWDAYQRIAMESLATKTLKRPPGTVGGVGADAALAIRKSPWAA
ncbi:unnamed protein product [Ostreobium quekettii]|uniref:Uncharacterized protein n=1 Tax=Ostreobium quekettii TaxID=121088 RepID=A0A8S1ILE2_9CHLO|nr:unnamed protein product [Ostreobium quekettii]